MNSPRHTIVTSPEAGVAFRRPHGARRSRGTGAARRFGFTILELLVVIAIIGIIAGLAVPAMKNLGASNIRLSAARQLLDDIGRARQLALSQRTTVYMIFMPTNFWDTTVYGYGPAGVPTTPAFSNLCADQLTGYTFVTLRSVGDQPGQGTPNYLAGWQTLPENNFIALWKFNPTNDVPTNFTDVVAQPQRTYSIRGFDRLPNSIPFPFANYTNPAGELFTISGLPYIAFNYLGQLTSGHDEYIPLAVGNMYAPTYGDSKIYQVGAAPTVTEIPPGNSYGPGYDVIHINWLTGRARQENQQVQ